MFGPMPVPTEHASWCPNVGQDYTTRRNPDALIDDGGLLSESETRALWGDR